VVCIVLCLLVEVIASWATSSSVRSWYVRLQKPAWTPPGWVFGPVWTVLYVSMGIAAWFVWRSRATAAITLPLSLFGVQLGLNLLWSFVFFSWRQPGWAFFEIVLLWLAVAATLLAFWPVSRPAAYLLVPYLSWVSYAAALNFAIWRANG
jgi:tryptophan-rich sensory protein